ncbi:hypothetical protein DNTS_013798 [Danionella cerebrum]|uniref:R3H domain-containing protein 1-like n=1 Tax=Danionella cerebrum TaxID=2873325 RepID=A0A553QQI6_9TELE|nr:hypothetical protein DNTS_013798 [Danionella translucida]
MAVSEGDAECVRELWLGDPTRALVTGVMGLLLLPPVRLSQSAPLLLEVPGFCAPSGSCLVLKTAQLIMSESSLDTRSCDVMKVLESDGPLLVEPPTTLNDLQHHMLQNNGTHPQECATDQSSSHQTQSNGKLKLVRSLAVCEEPSPPPLRELPLEQVSLELSGAIRKPSARHRRSAASALSGCRHCFICTSSLCIAVKRSESRIHEDMAFINTQQRRQIFRLRDGRSGNSHQSSSETEQKYSEPRPWSSTDSDSSHRNLKPSMTKANSFSGISLLIRGDSTTSSKSTGKLSKTSSDSSSSVASSSGSLSRPVQLPLPGQARAFTTTPAAPLPTTPLGGSTTVQASQSTAANANVNANTSFYIVPLDASTIPPGSVILNPQTGHPFVNHDGSHVVYNPAMTSQQGRAHQHMTLHPAPPPPPPPPPLPPSQPQPANHLLTPQQDGLSAQFSHMNLVRQASGDGPDPHTSLYPQSLLLQSPAPTGYVLSSTGQAMSGPIYPHPSQTVLQAHGYMHQPLQQVPACYCTPGQYSHSSQHYRGVTPVHYSTTQSPNLPAPPPQQTGFQAVMPAQAPGYQGIMGMQPTQNQSLVSSQGGMTNQIQSVMVQYPTMPPYQVSVQQGSQGVPQAAYQQQIMLQGQTNQTPAPSGNMQVYYSMMPPTQHSSISSTVGFLPPPGSEQMSFPRAPSPCGSQPITGQPCTAVPPPPPAGGMLMMQLSVPPNQQPRAQSPPQWKNTRYYKPSELPLNEVTQNNPQQLLSQSPSPVQSPAPTHLANLKGPRPGHAHFPIMPQFPRSYAPGQGDGRYPPLIGQPLQYNPPIRPPLMHGSHVVNHHHHHHLHHHQGVRHGGRARRPAKKSLSTDLSTGEMDGGRVLEVTDLPSGITRLEADSLLVELCKIGALIKWLPDSPSPNQSVGADITNSEPPKPPAHDLASQYTILALFPSKCAAQSALHKLSSSITKFKLRTSKEQPTLARSSSQ